MIHHKEYEVGTCEISSINGNLKNMVGSSILFAKDVVVEYVNPPVVELPEFQDSFFNWTFCKFATGHGRVIITFYAESDGYHNESVDFDNINSFACL